MSIKFKNLVYALPSIAVLFLIFWIWGERFGLEVGRIRAKTQGVFGEISSTSTEHFAWNDMIGWINFYNSNRVFVESRQLRGFASSSVGEISLNCDTGGNSGNVNYCGAPYNAPYKVKNNGVGELSGWAWNDLVGWISFCGGNATSSCPGDVHYKVLLDNPYSSGAEAAPYDFFGYAWNDIIGWISFNVVNDDSSCNAVENRACYDDHYKVRTSWYATSTYGDVYSSVFDTGVVGGAKFNSVNFLADEVGLATDPTTPGILFQLAISSSSVGPWNFVGPGGATSDFYRAAYDQSSPLRIRGSNYFVSFDNNYNNARYFRYRIRLKSNKPQTASPVVRDVVVNWSP